MADAVVFSEDQEQEMLIQWCSFSAKVYKGLDRIYAIPNGGHRDIRTATMLKRTGVKPGVPDLFIPVPKWKWHGMYIEMKRRKNGAVSEYQKEWIKYLNDAGYYAVVAHGFEEARQMIIDYWKGGSAA